VTLLKYYLCYGIKENEIGWTRGTRNIYRILVGIHEVKSPFGRTSCKWGNNIHTVFKKRGRKILGWIDLAQEGDK
jgi:hypothetical protein